MLRTYSASDAVLRHALDALGPRVVESSRVCERAYAELVRDLGRSTNGSAWDLVGSLPASVGHEDVYCTWCLGPVSGQNGSFDA